MYIGEICFTITFITFRLCSVIVIYWVHSWKDAIFLVGPRLKWFKVWLLRNTNTLNGKLYITFVILTIYIFFGLEKYGKMHKIQIIVLILQNDATLGNHLFFFYTYFNAILDVITYTSFFLFYARHKLHACSSYISSKL